MLRLFLAFSIVLHSGLAKAQVSRGGSVLNEDGANDGPLLGPWLLVPLAGAALGYFVERAWNKALLEKQGIRYTPEVLGGKTGAVIGAIGLTLIVGFFR